VGPASGQGAARVDGPRYSGYVAAKRGMADALAAVIATGSDPYRETPARLIAAVTTLTSAGVAAGTIRDDVPDRHPLRHHRGLLRAARRSPPARPATRSPHGRPPLPRQERVIHRPCSSAKSLGLPRVDPNGVLVTRSITVRKFAPIRYLTLAEKRSQ